ncbi:hypothetical protein P4O66_001132 [Electrophorus voltai]|uniref:Uncharacterized protein n=1 Tax=Electrophorus voltai TaxID=2609070 RepID=A0AAD8ZDA2_9TELE|nr:hypothetical protein P4O66_001132 [Electrophorus voltai]
MNAPATTLVPPDPPPLNTTATPLDAPDLPAPVTRVEEATTHVPAPHARPVPMPRARPVPRVALRDSPVPLIAATGTAWLA